jgi:hypothetical protein
MSDGAEPEPSGGFAVVAASLLSHADLAARQSVGFEDALVLEAGFHVWTLLLGLLRFRFGSTLRFVYCFRFFFLLFGIFHISSTPLAKLGSRSPPRACLGCHTETWRSNSPVE